MKGNNPDVAFQAWVRQPCRPVNRGGWNACSRLTGEVSESVPGPHGEASLCVWGPDGRTIRIRRNDESA